MIGVVWISSHRCTLLYTVWNMVATHVIKLGIGKEIDLYNWQQHKYLYNVLWMILPKQIIHMKNTNDAILIKKMVDPDLTFSVSYKVRKSLLTICFIWPFADLFQMFFLSSGFPVGSACCLDVYRLQPHPKCHKIEISHWNSLAHHRSIIPL